MKYTKIEVLDYPLRDVMQKNKISLRKLAKETGIGAPHISRLIKGTWREEFYKFADSLPLSRGQMDIIADFWLGVMSEKDTALLEKIQKMKYKLDNQHPQFPVRLTYNQACDDIAEFIKAKE